MSTTTTIIHTLQQISQQTLTTITTNSKQYLTNTIACIIDITKPIYRPKHNNYIIQIKLIDQTVNQSITQTPYLTKYLTLYLIAQTKQQIQFDVRIGDLLYLKKFLFYQWNKIQLQAKYYGTIQMVYLIKCDGLDEGEDFVIQKKLGKTNAMTSIINTQKQLITTRIVQLKNIICINFHNLFKPTIGIKIINNYCSLIEPYCMLLKSIRFQFNQFQQFMFLVDSNGNMFYLDVKQFKYFQFKEAEWFYIRGIKYITIDKQIILTPSGNVIRIPEIFNNDYQLQSHYQAIYRKTSKITNQKQQTTALTYISLFQQKPSTVKQLFDLQDKYKGTSKKQDIILQNNYLIKAVVVKYSGKIKLYHTEYQMIVHDSYLNEVPMQEKKQIIEDKKLVYIFEGTISLIDRSIITKRQTLKIKLFTNDMKSTFFDEKQLEKLNLFIGHSDSEIRVGQVLQRIYCKLEKLKQLSSFDNPVALVLEPVRSDQLIYRLINTKIV